MLKNITLYIKEFIRAARVFSLSLAIGSTSIGIIASWQDGSLAALETPRAILLIALITMAGIAIQLGANLINDYFEGSFKYASPIAPATAAVRFLSRDRTLFDVFIFLSGVTSLGFAGLIGLYLAYISSWPMLLIGLLGLVGSYGYTGEPIVYKNKGLGAALSFILMGPLMNLGAYYPIAKTLSWNPVILGLPLSLLIPALMISNEMRDYKDTGTLTGRIGCRWALFLYDSLLSCSLIAAAAFAVLGFYPPQSLLALLLLPIALKARGRVARHEASGIRLTNLLHQCLFMTLIIAFALAKLQLTVIVDTKRRLAGRAVEIPRLFRLQLFTANRADECNRENVSRGGFNIHTAQRFLSCAAEMEEGSKAEKLENFKNFLGYSEDNQRAPPLPNRPQQSRKGSDSRASHVGGRGCVNNNVYVTAVYNLRNLNSEEVRIVGVNYAAQMNYQRIFHANFLWS